MSRHNRGNEQAQAARALETFQSRPVRKIYDLDVSDQFPTALVGIGEPVHVVYYCDKDDPETRPPAKRARDPYGAVGNWKTFIHKHTLGRGLTLYDDGRRLPAELAEHADTIQIQWPDTVYWLGEFQEVRYQPENRKSCCTFRPQGKWNLWAFPDSLTIFAVPVLSSRRRAGDLLLWFGGDLRVGWRGIEG